MGSLVNPLRQINDLLWDMLERHDGWSDLVKVGNRVDYLRGDFPQMDDISTADLPEVGIIPVGTRMNLHGSSSSMIGHKLFSIVVATGKRAIGPLLDIEFQAYRAMCAFNTLKTSLDWKDHAFCTHMNLVEITDSMLEERGIYGWVSVWGCEVHMNLPLSLLTE
jgi:hypothetical protein